MFVVYNKVYLFNTRIRFSLILQFALQNYIKFKDAMCNYSQITCLMAKMVMWKKINYVHKNYNMEKKVYLVYKNLKNHNLHYTDNHIIQPLNTFITIMTMYKIDKKKYLSILFLNIHITSSVGVGTILYFMINMLLYL